MDFQVNRAVYVRLKSLLSLIPALAALITSMVYSNFPLLVVSVIGGLFAVVFVNKFRFSWYYELRAITNTYKKTRKQIFVIFVNAISLAASVLMAAVFAEMAIGYLLAIVPLLFSLIVLYPLMSFVLLFAAFVPRIFLPSKIKFL